MNVACELRLPEPAENPSSLLIGSLMSKQNAMNLEYSGVVGRRRV